MTNLTVMHERDKKEFATISQKDTNAFYAIHHPYFQEISCKIWEMNLVNIRTKRKWEPGARDHLVGKR